ncbi:MAG: lipoyl(octanoyl) transferase LipB [Proteobacteria bacterium]|nr:lipoyl(octanoyl) transferase LipB [Pseudomonadota bacterium]
MNLSPLLRFRGLLPYEPTWREMQLLTDERGPHTCDEIWFLEHPPVFTLGMNASIEHVLDAGDIPLQRIDRGGQVTYHGPGQLVVYPLLDLKRLGLGVRPLVSALEGAIIDYLAGAGVGAQARREAPGVYVGERKIASVGLRIRRGACYHGLAFNVNNDLSPFGRINVCGHRGLQVTRLADLGVRDDVGEVSRRLAPLLLARLGYSAIRTSSQAVSSR